MVHKHYYTHHNERHKNTCSKMFTIRMRIWCIMNLAKVITLIFPHFNKSVACIFESSLTFKFCWSIADQTYKILLLFCRPVSCIFPLYVVGVIQYSHNVQDDHSALTPFLEYQKAAMVVKHIQENIFQCWVHTGQSNMGI